MDVTPTSPPSHVNHASFGLKVSFQRSAVIVPMLDVYMFSLGYFTSLGGQEVS